MKDYNESMERYDQNMPPETFKEKAKKIIHLAEDLSETFSGDKIRLTTRQRHYLVLAIMAGLSDAHRNGFSNGIQ